MSRRAADDEVGSTIAGRYRIEQMLGRGGMATVYRVLDERSGRLVALKRCWSRDNQRFPRHAALLEREYHTLAELAHPQIIEVYDYGVDPSGSYYTMELLEGQELGNVEKLDWRDICAALRDIASSLAILHSRGLIHRDVALRNVHRAADGRIKLLDFGAMTSMGVAKDIVGTPPFMAPEVLQLQALDARVDLFSLGAVGYRLLTGRHAYPARRVSELRDLWRSRPQAPAVVVPGTPIELSQLILRMLTLDRAGRPPNAAEVIEKLNTIAGLPRENVAEISRAYLATPSLVGRDTVLLDVRRRLLSLVRGDGGVLLIQGPSGSGRSRMLDACALEAKLLGIAVVRADARDARDGDWAVAKALATRVFELFPAEAIDAARVTRNVLAHVVVELEEAYQTATSYVPERSVLLRELRNWMFELTKNQRLLIVVDDADRIDDPSAALLAAIADKSRRSPIVVAIAVEQATERAGSASLRLLNDIATPIELEDMLPHDTEALVRSLFGDAPNLTGCATRLHSLSNGNPRTTMELAGHLVDTGRAQYEGGSWSLPAALDEADLPRSLTDSLSARMHALSADARELACALALADGSAFRLRSYPALTAAGDSKRTYRALDELVAARILVADQESYSFAQRGFITVLAESVAPDVRAQLHARIAQELATHGDGKPIQRAEHLLAAGFHIEAINLLCNLDFDMWACPVPLLAKAIERGMRLPLSAAALHRLRMALIVNAPRALVLDNFREVMPIVLQQLENDSGLVRYRQLAHLPEPERLTQAFALTQAAHQALPAHKRVHGVFDAIRELARLSGAITLMGVATFDLELLESLPSLEPLFPLSPTLPVIAQIVEASKHWVSGRIQRSRALYEAALARVAEADRAGFDEAQSIRVRLALEHALGMLDARWGADAAEDRASLLEEHGDMRVNAWRIRALMYLARGNASEARRCSRRAELLEAQEGARERYGDSTVGIMLVFAARLGDLLSVKALLQRLAARAAVHHGWQAPYLLGRSYFCSLQGDLEGALQHAEAALEHGPSGRNAFFGIAAGARVGLLVKLGRVDEALVLAREYVQHCTEQELEAATLYCEAALVFARTGHREEAEQTLGRMFVQAEVARARGFVFGSLHEYAARVAILVRDRVQFDEHLRACTAEFELSMNPALGTALALLVDEAREHGLCPAGAELPVPLSIRPAASSDTEYETVHSRLIECVDAADRARCALTLLLESTSSCAGYLYGTSADQSLRLLAALPDGPVDPALATWAAHRAQSWAGPSASDEVTVSSSVTQEVVTTQDVTLDPEPTNYSDAEGRTYTAIPLYDLQAAARRLAAVFVPEIRPRETVVLSHSLTAAIAKELIEYRDAVGWSAGIAAIGWTETLVRGVKRDEA